MERAAFQIDLQPEDRLNAILLASRDKLDRAGEQTMIGETQSRHARLARGARQFCRRGDSFLQGVGGVAGEVDDHGKGAAGSGITSHPRLCGPGLPAIW